MEESSVGYALGFFSFSVCSDDVDERAVDDPR